MLFNSYDFFLFFPLVLIGYFIIPVKTRHLWLLIASYFFYMSWNPTYALLMIFSTVATFFSGIMINIFDRKEQYNNKKLVVIFCFILNLGILFFFKYFEFVLNNLNGVLAALHIQIVNKPFDLLLPVGISFYTFQALSYTVDIYRKDVPVEKNLLKYALFVSFFPQLVAGPIERTGNLLKQINEVPLKKSWDMEKIADGFILLVWGYFMKMVIADRIAIMVDTVFDSYYMYGTVELIIAAVGFAIQIYCDFASYSTIAIGAASIMGFTLMDNFSSPYFSSSIKEFWRRWHISLSTWFRDYLYIPLGGNRYGKAKRYRNLMITFLVSGLWHGANWTYVLWGGAHGIYQIIGEELRPIKQKVNEKMHTKTESMSYRLGQICVTFTLTTFAWVFFRATSIKDAVYYLSRLIRRHNFWTLFDGSLYKLGLERVEIKILLLSIFMLVCVDAINYFRKERIDVFLNKQCIWFRWGVLFALIWCIAVFGIYGPGVTAAQFIYFQF